MKVLGATKPIVRDSAASVCDTYGAVMSGIQLSAEVDMVLASSKNITGSLNAYTYTGVWMAGVRKGSCNFLNAEKTAACAGLLTFSLATDSYLSSYGMYTFVPNQPDSVVERDTRHNCLALLVSQTSVSYQGHTYNTA